MPNSKNEKIKSGLHGDMQNQAEMTWSRSIERGNRSNGPKVRKASLSKIWPYAGTSVL